MANDLAGLIFFVYGLMFVFLAGVFILSNLQTVGIMLATLIAWYVMTKILYNYFQRREANKIKRKYNIK